jgi:hypothetical protein
VFLNVVFIVYNINQCNKKATLILQKVWKTFCTRWSYSRLIINPNIFSMDENTQASPVDVATEVAAEAVETAATETAEAVVEEATAPEVAAEVTPSETTA